MELYKTTHETDWRRVRWVYDEDYDPVDSYAFADDKETQAALDVELTGLQAGTLVVLGALVELRCPHCRFWQDHDSVWGMVVDADEDLEAWGTECLDIPEDSLERRAHVAKDCEESLIGDTVPLSARAQDYVKKAAETPPKIPYYTCAKCNPDVSDPDVDYCDRCTDRPPPPPPPEGPPNRIVREDDTAGGCKPLEITEEEAHNLGRHLGWCALAILLLAVWVVVLMILLLGG